MNLLNLEGEDHEIIQQVSGEPLIANVLHDDEVNGSEEDSGDEDIIPMPNGENVL